MSSARAGELAVKASGGGGDTDRDSGVKQALEAVAAYIPAEALALFVSLYGLLQPGSVQLRTILIVIGIVALVVAIAAGFDFRLSTPTKRRRFSWLIVFGLVSFSAWLLAMPGGPFAGKVDLFGENYEVTLLGGASVLLLAFLLPVAAKALRLRP